MSDDTGQRAVPDERAADAEERADLDGHTIDELVGYLDAGRTPPDPSIEGSASCRMALAALERLQNATGDLLGPDAAGDSGGWVAAALQRISLDARPGRRFRFESGDPELDAVITEGAVRGLTRAVGDGVPGLVTGRVRILPDEAAGTARVVVQVALVYGARLPEAAADLDRSLRRALKRHLPLPLDLLDIEVVDVIDLRGSGA